MKIAIVVPSIREKSIMKFIDEWEIKDNPDYKLIVIEDNETKTFTLPNYIDHYSHKEINEQFPKPELIPRKTDAVRNFGFWKAHQEGYDYVLTLDDDCYPTDNTFSIRQLIQDHLDGYDWILDDHPRFYNTLEFDYPRGFPNWAKKQYNSKYWVSVGGWKKIPDLDGKTQLEYDNSKIKEYIPHLPPHYPKHKKQTTIIPYGTLMPVCGMHLFFPKEMIPFMYYFPTLNRFYRWADIWLGFVLKRFLDEVGGIMISGAAFIKHSRASNPYKNEELESTNNGYEVNDAISLHILNTYKQRTNDFYDILAYTLDRLQNTNLSCEDQQYFCSVAKQYLQWYNLYEEQTWNGEKIV